MASRKKSVTGVGARRHGDVMDERPGVEEFRPSDVLSPPYAYVLLLVVGTSSLPTRRVVVRCGVYVLEYAYSS